MKMSRLLAAEIYWLAGAAALLLWGGQPGIWRATHWLFTYQDGIPRRGLAGSILRLGGELTYQRITVASWVLYVVAVAVLGWGLSALVNGNRRVFLTVLILVVSPLGFPFLVANLGRFDVILMILAVPAVWLVNRRHDVLLCLTVAVMVLVHEAALFLVVVWLAALLVRRQRPKLAMGVLLLATTIAAGLLLWTPPVDQAQMTELVATDFLVAQESIGVLYTNVSANIAKGLSYISSTNGVVWLGEVAVAASAVIAAAWRMRDPWLLAGSLAPLSLILTATDYERWAAFAAGLLIVSTAMTRRELRSDKLLVFLVVWAIALTFLFDGGLQFNIART